MHRLSYISIRMDQLIKTADGRLMEDVLRDYTKLLIEWTEVIVDMSKPKFIGNFHNPLHQAQPIHVHNLDDECHWKDKYDALLNKVKSLTQEGK